MIDTAPDALRCILDSLILDESCHESLKVMKNLSCVCKATVAVMNNPSFVASVCVPWLAPYRVQLRILAVPARVLRAMILLEVAERAPKIVLGWCHPRRPKHPALILSRFSSSSLS